MTPSPPAREPAPDIPVPGQAQTSPQQNSRERAVAEGASPAAGESGLLSPADAGGRAEAALDPAGGEAAAKREEASTAPSVGSTRIAAAMTEDRGRDSLDAHVRRLMKDLGLRGFHAHDARRSAKGYPDWTIAGPGGQLWRELKTQRGRLTREQQEWLDTLAAGGGNAGVWRPIDLLSGQVARELVALAIPVLATAIWTPA